MALVLENTTVDFEQITLGIPNQLQKNVFFSRIFLDDNPIYIQTNECFTSSGIKETNTKSFCDLIYRNNETIVNFFTNFHSIYYRITSSRSKIKNIAFIFIQKKN